MCCNCMDISMLKVGMFSLPGNFSDYDFYFGGCLGNLCYLRNYLYEFTCINPNQFSNEILLGRTRNILIQSRQVRFVTCQVVSVKEKIFKNYCGHLLIKQTI